MTGRKVATTTSSYGKSFLNSCWLKQFDKSPQMGYGWETPLVDSNMNPFARTFYPCVNCTGIVSPDIHYLSTSQAESLSSLISKITKDHESLLICEGRGSFIKACEFGFVSGFGASLDFFRPQMEGSKSLNQLRQSLNASCLFVGCVSGHWPQRNRMLKAAVIKPEDVKSKTPTRSIEWKIIK